MHLIMKILQVITSLRTGGAEKLIVDMVPLYQQKGYKVDVLLFDGADTPLKKQLQNKGVIIYELGQGGSVYNPVYLLKLIPILRKYDIVHTHNTACQLFVAIASLFCSTILVTTEHNTSNRRRNWKWFKIFDKWMYGRYKSVICISDKAYDNLQQYLGSNKSLQVIYNGVDIALYRNAEADNSLKNGKIIVTMVAGFRPQKDQATLIKAFQYLPTDKYELWLIGDGERRSELEKLVLDLKFSNVVKFWGIRNDIPVLLKTSDIIIMSSHYEGLSLSSIEGMSVGKPFVASDVDGLREITINAGILFQQGDAKALSDIILRLHEDPVYYQQIADQCLQRAVKYDIHKTVDQYLQLYQSLCR